MENRSMIIRTTLVGMALFLMSCGDSGADSSASRLADGGASSDYEDDWGGDTDTDSDTDTDADSDADGDFGDEADPPDNQGDQFEDVGTNPFVTTAHDPFSTFAADVDTASYDIFRRDVNNGYLPARRASG